MEENNIVELPKSEQDNPKVNYHNVALMVTVPHDNQWVENSLTLRTLRIGFPNAVVHVWTNANSPEITKKLITACEQQDYRLHDITKRKHHAQWIKEMIERHDGELTILDPDIIFYEQCEDFDFPTLLAGRFVPVIWNEFAAAISYERLHTAFLMVRDCRELREMIVRAYPNAWGDYGVYSPVDPYMPSVKFHNGYPMFWDTCSTLFHMVGGSCFTEHHLKRFSHVNSSAFQEVMEERVSNKEGFRLQHQKAREFDIEWFKDFWKAEEKYYMDMHAVAVDLMTSRRKATQPQQPQPQPEQQ